MNIIACTVTHSSYPISMQLQGILLSSAERVVLIFFFWKSSTNLWWKCINIEIDLHVISRFTMQKLAPHHMKPTQSAVLNSKGFHVETFLFQF
jgi:hypothetical protein